LFARVRAGVGDRLEAAGPGAAVDWALVLLALGAFLVHFVVAFSWAQPWYIEDSAISFAYARNWVEGDGLVPWVGGERVEGYSNALWTYLIGVAYAVGVSPWTSSKVMGAVFGCFAQIFAWRLARRALPQEQQRAAVLVPWLLAGSTQFTLWNASGLENGLFCMLLAAGLWSLVREVEDERLFPWSAFAFFLLSMTRPDGLAYAGIGLIGRTLGTLARRQWGAWLAWVVAFGLPWGAYNAWRLSYFAWEWPLTWYAKRKAFTPLDYSNNYGWKQLREYLFNYGIVWAIPALVFGAMGMARWRRFAAITLCAVVAGVVLWDGRAGLPPGWKVGPMAWASTHWNDVRVYTISGAMALVGLCTFGQPRWLVRGLLWCCYGFGLFFTILATGDWMKAFRWFNLTSVPQFTLLLLGLSEVAEWLPFAGRTIRGVRPVRLVLLLAPSIGLAATSLFWTQKFILRPETAPRDVKKRVDYMSWVERRLDLDRVRLLDVDMGAHLWYTDWFIADIAGLVDVPMAQHEYEKAFIHEYLFEEFRPDFAHVHGSWGRTMRITSHPEWKEQYLEIPGFPTGKKALHVGNHVRKDLIVEDSAPASAERRVRFDDNVRMESWELPAPAVAPGGELFVDTLWRAGKRSSGLRVLLFLAREGAVAWVGEVTPGYDWYKAPKWQPWEYVGGRWSVELPNTLSLGEYRLGLVVLDEAVGVVLPLVGEGPGGEPLWMDDPDPTVDASQPADASDPEPTPDADAASGAHPLRGEALYMRGEWLFPEPITLVTADDARGQAEGVLTDALGAASAGDCESAQRLWKTARHHVAKNARWQADRGVDARDAIVRCLVARTARTDDDESRAAILAEARFIEPRHAAIREAGEALGARLEAAGDAAGSSGDWETAFRSYRAAMNADPTRAGARRKCEDARDRRLKLRMYDPKSKVKENWSAFGVF
jgi:hypothetical protein